jgi:HNH endonuclease
MSPHTQTFTSLNLVVVVVIAILTWYLYQIGSRKREWLRYKVKRTIVALVGYLITALILAHQRLPPIEAVILAMLAGLGGQWLLVHPPKNERRIPKAVRRAVIARDLTSRGLKWNPQRHHIDHVVPFSRGGDHSTRNLRVMEKERNLSKGDKMPSLWDFLRREKG